MSAGMCGLENGCLYLSSADDQIEGIDWTMIVIALFGTYIQIFLAQVCAYF